MRAVVLSGGGAKGAYEIGVWKALRKNHIHYDIVTGTSVGALNGVMMVQNDYHKAIKVWRKINHSKILEHENFENKIEMYKFYAKNGLKGGASVNGLEKIMEDAINERKFFKSKTNFGIVTYNLSKLKPIEIEKKDIKKGYLKNYVIASATCFPFFKKKKIDGNDYIDGGFHDNLPINLAIQLGATEVIAIDLKAVGIKQKIKNKDVKITYIIPHNDTGSFLDFKEENAIRNIKLGYNDTMKVFNKLEGNIFTFKKNHLLNNYNKYYSKFYNIIEVIFGKIQEEIFFDNFIKNKKNIDLKQEYFNNILEKCGEVFNLDNTRIYRTNIYNYFLLKKIENISYKKGVPLKEILDKKQVIKEIIDLLNKRDYKKVKKYNVLCHQEIILAVYLYVIEKNDII